MGSCANSNCVNGQIVIETEDSVVIMDCPACGGEGWIPAILDDPIVPN